MKFECPNCENDEHFDLVKRGMNLMDDGIYEIWYCYDCEKNFLATYSLDGLAVFENKEVL